MTSKVEFKTFLFSYRYEGKECVLEIRAENEQDAKRRVGRLQYATYDGELMGKIPASPATSRVLGPILSFICSLLPRGAR